MADDGNLANLDAMRTAQASSSGGSSVFRDAETAMFGGASAPTVPQVPSVKIPGVPSIGGVSLGNADKPTVPTFKGELQNQFNTLMDTAKKTLRMRQNGIPVPKDESVAPQAQVPQMPSQAAPAQPVQQPAGPEVQKIGGLASQNAGVTMRTVGGRQSYGYKSKDGVDFDLPDGIDVNDDAAVSSAIKANEDAYAMMNELYED